MKQASDHMKISSLVSSVKNQSHSSRLILLLGVAVCTLCVAAPSSSRAESLAEAIAMAYASNPALARERSQQRANDENYVAARSRFRA